MVRAGCIAHIAWIDCSGNYTRCILRVVPVLIRLFARFGQNERSLYSFLLSNEPHALQPLYGSAVAGCTCSTTDHLADDYGRGAFGHRLAIQSFRSHWNQIESVVESFPKDQEFELQILKTLNFTDWTPTDLLATATQTPARGGGSSPDAMDSTKKAIKELQKGKSVLYYRGIAGGHCLWPHTSVNLERAHQEASDAVPIPSTAAPFIRERLATRPLVARRHYIETGNLRHFDVVLSAPDDVAASISKPCDADGVVIVALCETESERTKASDFAKSGRWQRERTCWSPCHSP